MRDDFATPIKDTLARRAGMRCSNPNCRKPTCGPRDIATKALNIGVACHITAASPGGPRFDSAMTGKARTAMDNGIWLCQTCSKLIDSDAERFTTDTLRQWKHLGRKLSDRD